ncbi:MULTISPECIES: inositol monophosphatase family protein [unclassified Devosia]|uniref:inositol monophosphatase family protein n=1 Tax=unclassified Devosia TaxID=196773 RepID=UPI00145C51E7|nr:MULTISPECIES: inositol monophosphatase family protein [unclassified Devosia]MBJ6987976.1 inositol monophosphatase [Devosia sp. MC521]MBJ7578499.1 inositol monophosphatase [Devosia sp. MC532]MBK1794707.1 inositol monophosphatase [Devosia sp. WQ 349K1]QMW62053.1 inositol monophosphatase [Devosia sp. MC521]
MARSALLNVMVSAAIKAGKSLTRDFNEVENLQVSRKGPADFVSKADLRAEQIIYDELRKARPSYAFLMEEGGEVAGTDGQHTWIVDPLDGTTNFLHGIPLFAVAIALQRGDDIVASVIYNPVLDELYTAEKGGGAWLADKKRLRVGARRHLADAVVSTGIKTQGTSNDVLQIKQVASINAAVAGIRRSGSICVDMAWLAAGRFDALWEAGLKPWDVAPGLLLVKEAGGVVSDYAGQPGSVANGQLVAGNETLQPLLLKALRPIH